MYTLLTKICFVQIQCNICDMTDWWQIVEKTELSYKSISFINIENKKYGVYKCPTVSPVYFVALHHLKAMLQECRARRSRAGPRYRGLLPQSRNIAPSGLLSPSFPSSSLCRYSWSRAGLKQATTWTKIPLLQLLPDILKLPVLHTPSFQNTTPSLTHLLCLLSLFISKYILIQPLQVPDVHDNLDPVLLFFRNRAVLEDQAPQHRQALYLLNLSLQSRYLGASEKLHGYRFTRIITSNLQRRKFCGIWLLFNNVK